MKYLKKKKEKHHLYLTYVYYRLPFQSSFRLNLQFQKSQVKRIR